MGARSDSRRSAWTDLVEKAFGGAVTPALHFLAKDAKLSKKDEEILRQFAASRGEQVSEPEGGLLSRLRSTLS